MKKILALVLVVTLVSTGLGLGLALAAEPTDCNTNAVGIALSAYKGGSPTSGPVYEGDVITYRVTLTLPALVPPEVGCNFYGGQLSVTLPDGTVVQLAGFGAPIPDVPTVSLGSPFAIFSTVDYVVDSADMVGGVVTAYADYGETIRQPAQINGTFKSDPVEEQSASATTSRSLAVINPDTDVDITASADMIYCDDPVELTICETNTGDDPLTNVYVELSEDGVIVDTLPGPDLAPGETYCWPVIVAYPADDIVYDAIGHGTDPAGNDVTFPEYPDEYAEVPVEVICPNTDVDISASADVICEGDPVELTICETNTGTEPLTNVYVELSEDGVIVDTLPGPDLAPGETYCWPVIVAYPANNIVYDAIGHGTDPAGNDVTFPEYPDEYAEVPVTVEPCAEEGCTPGFWKVQPKFDPPHCWECFSPDDQVGWVFLVPSELSELADDTLDDALRYHGGRGIQGAARNLLRQATAALLNACHSEVDYPMSVAEVIAATDAALATLDRGEMLRLKDVFDMNNNLGCPIDNHCRPCNGECD